MKSIISTFSLFILFLLSTFIPACTPLRNKESSQLQTIGTGEGRLDIVAWEGYMERGENDTRYDWVTPFEQVTGCKINVKVAGTSDEMVMLMNQGGFDLVTASGDASNRLISGGKVQPINIDLIPSWTSIDPRLQNAPWHTVNETHYGTPFQWAPNVLMYNTDTYDKTSITASDLFIERILPDGLSNKGRIQAYEGPIAIADAALYLMNTQPELGIRDPFELTRVQFGEVISLLREQRKLVSDYWNDASGQVDEFISQGNAASYSWPFQVRMLSQKGQPISSVVPHGGATGRTDTFMLSSGALHPNCAYLWMEYSLAPKVQGDVAAWAGTNPVVPSACQASELLGSNGCELNGYFDYNDIYFWKTPVTDCGNGKRDCVPYSDWVTAYISIIGGH